MNLKEKIKIKIREKNIFSFKKLAFGKKFYLVIVVKM
jgi:hypothetical protein